MAEHHTHLVSQGLKRQREAPQDMENCGIGCYIWGTQLPIIVDILVLGHSLKEQGNKAKRYLCIHGDTHGLKMSMLFEAFWELVPVSHVKLPQHLQGSELNRLQGVYSKLQTVKIFAERRYALKRFLLLDGDMLVRSNIDDIFSTNVPAAVMRGPADTCLYNRRPSHTYFKQGMERSFTRGGQKMKGGMNGGLVLFEPNVHLYEDMYSKLQKFQPRTNMAEQEFLSWFFGREGDWNAIHKKNNFQIHQMYFQTPTPPPGQQSHSTYEYMIENPEHIRVYHFSADHKPSHILVDEMPSVEGWVNIKEYMKKHQQLMMEQHGTRNPDFENYPEWVETVQKLEETAYREWLDAWKRTYLSLVQFVMSEAYKNVFGTTPRNKIKCHKCGTEWEMADIEQDANLIRDHILFNCPSMTTHVCIPVKHATNLMTFFFVPCGAQVESKLVYLGELHHYYTSDGSVYPWRATHRDKGPLPLNCHIPPNIRLPLYKIPSHILAVTEDVGLSAADACPDQANHTNKAMRRRYERAMDRIRRTDIYAWKTNSDIGMTWEGSLTTAHEAGVWLMKHEAAVMIDEAKKTEGGSGPSSSSTEMHQNICMPPPPPQKRIFVPPPAHPLPAKTTVPHPPPPPAKRQ